MNVEENNAYPFKIFHAVSADSFTALAEDTSKLLRNLRDTDTVTADKYLIRKLRIIDGTREKPALGQDILVENGLIEAIGPSAALSVVDDNSSSLDEKKSLTQDREIISVSSHHQPCSDERKP